MKQLILQDFPDGKGRLKLDGRDFHYIAEVRRESEGSFIHARLPSGEEQPFRIESIDRQKKELFLASSGKANGGGAGLLPIVLFQWILKARAMDLVIRQATEAGARLIVPVAGRRCVPQARAGEKSARWERIVREARQQSGSAVNTEVAAVIGGGNVREALKDAGADGASLLIMLDEIGESGKTLHECVAGKGEGWGANAFCSAALAVGPEGGMTAEEKEELAVCGFEGVHFNTNILRAETAALYGIAAVQNAIMEHSRWRLNA